MKRIGGLLLAVAACKGSSAGTADAPRAGSGDAPAVVDAPASGARMYQQLITYTDALHAMVYARGFVYAVHSSADSVEVFDAVTRAHVGTIPVGHVPGDLATDGQRVYVANMTARDAGDPYVSVIDPSSQTVVAQALVSELVWGSDPNNYPWTNFPTNLAVLGSQLFVVFPTNAVPGLVPIDLPGLTEHTYQAAGSGASALAGVGTRLVITDLEAIGNFNDDQVRIQTTDGTVETSWTTGGKLHDARTVADHVWIAHAPVNAAGELLVVDPATASTQSIPTAMGAYGIAVSGNLVYVTCTEASRVQVFDATSHQLVEDIDLASVAPGVVNARGIAATPSGDIFLESDGMLSALYR